MGDSLSYLDKLLVLIEIQFIVRLKYGSIGFDYIDYAGRKTTCSQKR